MSATKKVIWAVDAFAQDKKLQMATFKALARMTEASNATIEPVCVLSPDQLKVPRESFDSSNRSYRLEAETRLRAWLKELKHPRLSEPTLLLQKKYSVVYTAETLLKYAQESKADLIALGTHTRKGVARFFFGSFAETLILRSSIPVFIVNAKSPVAKKIKNILFPTDFSEISREVYDQVLEQAKTLGAKVTLYYKFEYLTEYTVDSLSLSREYLHYFERDKEYRRKTANEWAALGKKWGVKTNVVLDEKGIYVAEGILKAATKGKCDLIAMASHSTPMAATMIGSVARFVVRRSTLPVWVIHPERTAERISPTKRDTSRASAVAGRRA